MNEKEAQFDAGMGEDAFVKRKSGSDERKWGSDESKWGSDQRKWGSDERKWGSWPIGRHREVRKGVLVEE